MAAIKLKDQGRDLSPKRHKTPSEYPFETWEHINPDSLTSSFGRLMTNGRIISNGILPSDEEEIFKTHPTYSNLEISNLGNVKKEGVLVNQRSRSISNAKSWTLSLPEFGIWKNNDNRSITRVRLMADTFLGIPNSMHYHITYLGNRSELKLSLIFWKAKGDITQQEWKPIPPPFSKYMYSEKNGGCISRYGRVLKTRTVNGYPQVAVISDSGKLHQRNVHALIALATLGVRPQNMIVAHLDDNKTNNEPSNHEYQTISQNRQQEVKKWGQPIKAYDDGGTEILTFQSYMEAGRYFKVTHCCIMQHCKSGHPFPFVFNGKTWRVEKFGKPERVRKTKHLCPDRDDWVAGSCEKTMGYEFSPIGIVHRIGSKYLLSTYLRTNYMTVSINGSQQYIHVLMLEVFVSSRPSPAHNADHIDENRYHNCITNLQWTTKNVERSSGVACERLVKADMWERFPSMTAAAHKLLEESGLVDSNSDIFRKQVHSIKNNITLSILHSRKANGYFWRKLKRGPPVFYICQTCEKQFQRPGDFTQ